MPETITEAQNEQPPAMASPEIVLHEEQDFFGPPPLIPGEDPLAYAALLARVKKDVRPCDVFEEMWVRELADLMWEALRLRRINAAVYETYAWNRIDGIVNNPPLNDDLMTRWARREPQALVKVNERLAASGLTIDVVMREAFGANVDDLELIDRMRAGGEARRIQILRELHRHFDTVFAAAVREASKKDGMILIGDHREEA